MRNHRCKLGQHVRPSLFFLLGGICLLLSVLSIPLTLIFFTSAVLHELGHITAMYLLRIPIVGFYTSHGGAVLRGDFQRISYRREMLAAVAGPLVNVMLSLCFSCSSWVYGKEVCILNLMLACYNLLPLDGNDGAVILAAAAAQLCPEQGLHRRLAWLSDILLAVLLMMGAWIFWYGALADPGGNSVGYGALFFCVLMRSLSKDKNIHKIANNS